MMTKYIITSFLSLMLLFTTLNIHAQCIEDSHTSFKNQGWMSCKASDNIIKERGKSHWIQYDLGDDYVLTNARIWNHNVWGETGQGVKSIILDYSLDGSNWASAGQFNIEKAPGSWKYVAPEPIELNAISARFVQVTVLETWEQNSSCAGISEIRFGLGATTSTQDDLEELGQINIYPNPASEQITLDFESNERRNIKIINSVGQIVREIRNVTADQIDVSVIDLEDGMYYIKTESDVHSQLNSFTKIKN